MVQQGRQDRELGGGQFDRLAAHGAHFRDVSGWEGADWYLPRGMDPKPEQLSWGRQEWFAYWQAEHQATRGGVILMDMSFMSKFRVEGRDAGRLLNFISANDVDAAPGVITYTSGSTRVARSKPTSR